MSFILDMQEMIFSLVIIRPKEGFFEWLNSILLKSGLTLEQVYFPEENGVWLIPAIGTFDDELAFENYLNKIKPIISRVELGKFVSSIDDVPNDITLAFCHDFFDFEIRDRANLASDLVKN